MKHLGIDLSKDYFDATLLDESGKQIHVQVENNKKGFIQLQKWLKKHKVVELHACMEATNVYWEELADYLHAKGYTVSVVNPSRTKGFGMSQMQRNKTDKVDSKVIAMFCAAVAPKAWYPPTEAQRKIRRLVRHREALVKASTQQKNRLADCRDDDVRTSLKMLIATLESEKKHFEKEIAALIKQDSEWQAEKNLLDSITGFGDITIHTIMAEMYDLANYEDAHAVAADAGVNPSHHESGKTIRKKPKMSKVGKSSIRRVLYMAAMSAIRDNPVIRDLAQRLERQGKEPMLIIGAAMRKLMHIAYGVLKNKTPFDPDWEKRAASAPATP